MLFIYCVKIRKKEAGSSPYIFTDEIIEAAAREVARGLSVSLGGFSGGKCLKLEVTSKGGAGRTIWRVKDKYLTLLLARSKKDPVGKNMTPKNPKFTEALMRAFAWSESDLLSGDFEVIEIGD